MMLEQLDIYMPKKKKEEELDTDVTLFTKIN